MILGFFIVVTVYYLATLAMIVWWIGRDVGRLERKIDQLGRPRTTGPPSFNR